MTLAAAAEVVCRCCRALTVDGSEAAKDTRNQHQSKGAERRRVERFKDFSAEAKVLLVFFLLGWPQLYIINFFFHKSVRF